MECIDKWLLRNNRLCPVCKRRVIPGGSDSESEDGGHDSSANTSTGLLAAADQTRSNQQDYIESAPNEDEDTNESSRLLVTSNVTVAAASNSSSSPHLQNVNTNRRAQTDDSASLLVGNHQHPSLSEMNEITSDLISLNNHMTTSIGSGASTQIFLQSGGASTNGNLLNPNQSIASKYGSISSINQINSNSNVKISATPYQYQNLNYQVK